MAKRVAVIDIGSSSIRLAVYEKTSRFAFHLLNESKSRVRLSQNAYQNNNNLQEEAMQRTIDSLKDFLTIISSYKARKTLCVATSALREAPNKQEFILRVREELKLNIKVIDGQREAYLGGIACANLLPTQHNALSIDIGGGSTELALINDKNISKTLSINLGTIRIKELFLDSKNTDEAIAYIDSKLQMIDNLDVDTLVGVGGTFRAISTAILKNTKYPLHKIHAFSYKENELREFLVSVLDANEKELLSLGIRSDRFDIIKPGALILQRVLKKLLIKKIITSGVGVREGVFLSDLLRGSKDKFPTHYNTSMRYLLDAHVSEKKFANLLNSLAKKIFDLTHKHLGIDKKYRKDLAMAAKLYPSGGDVHFYSKNKHSYYLVQSALEYGVTHNQITLIATLCKYAKKKLPSSSHLQKYALLLPDTNTTNALSYLLSLSISLLVHRPRNIDFELVFCEGILKIKSSKNLCLSKEAVEKLEVIENLKTEF
ncbi:Ppx/GppA phosphatase family protein [Sulfurimonas sp.]|uniref:Ppx/GppA phosphatase family protein n=1 Tax=Sulfurimonas sp. TaxID=2022749 RepID=UPI002AB0CB80|nr:Ppx/GppA phosphatase family protein [Sulfurimonas sp.]